MKWETARLYLHSVDVNNIKYEMRKLGETVSNEDIDYIFMRLANRSSMTKQELLDIERRFEASIGY